ncbi:MAG: ATP-dependent helicase/nuclease subunit A, partial [Cyclobacteriaceae bacterium]
MASRPFQVYRSSAGSGKTYTLALAYLKLALASPLTFQQILAVTFTNKATAEMKHRILEILSLLAQGKEHSMRGELRQTLLLSDAQLSSRAVETLSMILHRFGQFSVSTIDSFFHKVIRTFARDIGLQGSFTITLDTKTVLLEVIDQLMQGLGAKDQTQLKKWLIQFAASRLEEGESWDTRKNIFQLGTEIFKDEFKEYAEPLLTVTPQTFDQLQKSLSQTVRDFESQLKQIGLVGLKLVDEVGGIDVLKGKSRSPAGLFQFAIDGRFEISDGRLMATDDLTYWLTKKVLDEDAQLASELVSKVLPKYVDLIDFIQTQSIHYHSAKAVLRHLYTLGIISQIVQQLQRYRDENDVMLIPDLSEFLRKIIRDSDTPFIYERIGTRYQHFLLDEFQDTSDYQWQNFKPLIQNAIASGQYNMVVGDAKQSIYRWRGGDWRLLQSGLASDFEGMVDMQSLTENHRSAHEIVTFNNHLFEQIIGHDQDILPDFDRAYQYLLDEIAAVYADIAQAPQSEDKGGQVHIQFISETDDWKAEAIQRCIRTIETLQREGHAVHDIAILTRSTSDARLLSKSILDYGQSEAADPALSYQVVSSEALLLEANQLVRLIIALLKWLQDEEDVILMREWFILYHGLVSPELTVGQVLERVSRWREDMPPTFSKYKQYLKTLPAVEIVESVIRIFELGIYKESYAYLQGFQDAVLDNAKNAKGDLTSFLNWWEEYGSRRSIQLSENSQAVQILTIHKSKGLEFPIVIIPFLHWNLDMTTGFQEQILWCKPPDQAPYDQLPVLPLKYSSSLKETYWAADYWKERAGIYLDAINLLYVAMTRAVSRLIAFSPEADAKGRISHVGEVVHFVVSQADGWNPETLSYESGTMTTVKSKGEEVDSEQLQEYASFSWRGRVSLQLKAQRLEASIQETSDPRAFGILLHDALGSVRTVGDLAKYENSELYQSIREIVTHPDVLWYFSDVTEVRTESSILLPDGSMKRIDRLLKKNEKWYLVDFKTGEERKSDVKQVTE